jgi:hypothetical protein
LNISKWGKRYLLNILISRKCTVLSHGKTLIPHILVIFAIRGGLDPKNNYTKIIRGVETPKASAEHKCSKSKDGSSKTYLPSNNNRFLLIYFDTLI